MPASPAEPPQTHIPGSTPRTPRTGGSLGYLILAGALHGAVAWGTYFVVEYVLFTLVPLPGGTNSMLAATQWRVTALLALLFPIAGFISGGVAALVVTLVRIVRRRANEPFSTRRLRALAALTVSACFTAGLLTVRPLGKAGAFALTIGVMLTLGLLWSSAGRNQREWLGSLGNPWFVSLALLTADWTGGRLLIGARPIVKLAAAVFVTLASAGLTVLITNPYRKRSHLRKTMYPILPGATLLLSAAIALIYTLLSSRGLPAVPPVPPSAAGHPNVVLITMDAVRADHLSVYGYDRDTTPFLEDFAKRATVYTNAIATSDFTPPTHASLFTGLYASWHEAHFAPPQYPAGRPLAGGYPTIASILSAHGYHTLAVVANWGGLSREFGLNHGFQVYDARRPRAVTDPRLLRHALGSLVSAFLPIEDLEARFRRAAEINSAAIALLGRVARRQAPFFLFVNYMDSHVPYVPPRAYCRFFPPAGRPMDLYAYVALQNLVMTGVRPLTFAERSRLVSQYEGGIRYIDSQLAALFGRMEGLGLLDNTLVIICSDHGEAFGEHGLMQHGVSVYQDQVHIPLIIRYPHQTHPRVITGLVSQVDVLPTVMGALGLEAPQAVQGTNLLGFGDDTRRFVVSESFYWAHVFNGRLERVERAIFSGNHKFISSTTGKRELYDLSGDPNELQNLASRDPEEERTLQKRLTDWVRVIPSPTANDGSDGSRLVNVLRSLGYVQ
jgi:arylsulfatase A-like enzyme